MNQVKNLLPRRSDYSNFKSNLKFDLVAGITVGIVALPLALAFGITTGAGARAGLITAIFAGAITAIFGGSNYQVSGPTGAMTVVLVPIVAKYGVNALAPLGILAGLIVLLLGIFQAGTLINRIPWPVMEGFTLGIAIVIALQQIPTALATETIKGSGTVSTAFNTFKGALHNGVNRSALLVVALTLLIKFSYPKVAQKLRIKFHIPASFLAILLASLIVITFNIRTPRVGELPNSVLNFQKLGLAGLKVSSLLIAAIEIALLAAIESLLSARVADQMAHIHKPENAYQPNRELFGQGLATLISSMVGGMPATGAIARTGVNVRSGAKSRISALVHALFLLIVVLVLSSVISRIPTAALAGVLLGTSYRIASPANLREILKTTKLNSSILLLTASIVVFVDLIWGILIGTAIYVIARKILERNKQN